MQKNMSPLKIFCYDNITGAFKIIPNLIIEEETNNILFGKLRLCAVVYHIGNSEYQGHFVYAMNDGQSSYAMTIELTFVSNLDVIKVLKMIF